MVVVTNLLNLPTHTIFSDVDNIHTHSSIKRMQKVVVVFLFDFPIEFNSCSMVK